MLASSECAKLVTTRARAWRATRFNFALDASIRFAAHVGTSSRALSATAPLQCAKNAISIISLKSATFATRLFATVANNKRTFRFNSATVVEKAAATAAAKSRSATGVMGSFVQGAGADPLIRVMCAKTCTVPHVSNSRLAQRVTRRSAQIVATTRTN